MTSHVGRLYALALALVVFFGVWVVVAARPWAATATDPRLRALALREAKLRREAALVDRVVARRQAAYERALRVRRAEIAAARRQTSAPAPPAAPAPAVRVVTLPPLTITRSS